MRCNDTLVKSAILHDVGKICIRADHSLGEHSKAGCEFLKQYLQDGEESKEILRCIKYHHASNLKNANLHLYLSNEMIFVNNYFCQIKLMLIVLIE